MAAGVFSGGCEPQAAMGLPPELSALASDYALSIPDLRLNKLQIFQSILAMLPPGRLLDLGAGRGNFSLAAAHLGWEATAVDARTTRLPDPVSVEDATVADLIRSVTWVQADVRDFPIQPQEYDLICILGLLHHLEVADQHALLRRCASTLTLIDTRTVAVASVQVNGYQGAMITEHGATRAERDLVPTASWGNALSFRHTEASLLRLARESGYARMMQMRPAHRRNYTFYLCLPPPARTTRRMVRRPRRPQPAGPAGQDHERNRRAGKDG